MPNCYKKTSKWAKQIVNELFNWVKLKYGFFYLDKIRDQLFCDSFMPTYLHVMFIYNAIFKNQNVKTNFCVTIYICSPGSQNQS